MSDTGRIDYATLDVPEVLMRLFHPRPEFLAGPTDAQEVMIPVAPEVVVGARFHSAARGGPTVLFFHGNGEIVADYDELGPYYTRMGLNFFPVDYRGYGRSTGTPTVAAMMEDCHTIYAFVDDWLKDNGHQGPLIVMGRSLGSASALELAASQPDRISGLIVESGFAYAGPLLQVLGIDVGALGFIEEAGFRNVDKIKKFVKPTLIIHAEHDHIITFANGQALYDASASPQKTLLKIAGANHNDILLAGFSEYMGAVKNLADIVSEEHKSQV